MYVYMCVCVCVCMYVCMYVCIYVCMYVCMYGCMYVSIYLTIYHGRIYIESVLRFRGMYRFPLLLGSIYIPSVKHLLCGQ